MKHINPIDMFHTPKDITEVEKWIEKHNPEDRFHLHTASMMTWNLMAGYHNKAVNRVDCLEQVIGMLLEQVQDYSENEVINGDGRSMTIDQIKELIGNDHKQAPPANDHVDQMQEEIDLLKAQIEVMAERDQEQAPPASEDGYHKDHVDHMQAEIDLLKAVQEDAIKRIKALMEPADDNGYQEWLDSQRNK